MKLAFGVLVGIGGAVVISVLWCNELARLIGKAIDEWEHP